MTGGGSPSRSRPILATAAAAVAMDLALRAGGIGVAGALLVLVIAAGMLASGRMSNPQARGLVAAAPLFGVWLAIRTSPWLIPLDVLAAAGLLLLGASMARGGSVVDLSLPRGAIRGSAALGQAVITPAFAAGPARATWRRLAALGSSSRTRSVARGILLAAPLLILLGILLASADAVFAATFRVRWSIDPAAASAHAAGVLAGAWGMAGLLRAAAAPPPGPVPAAPRRIGPLEATIILGSVVALFAAFAAVQLFVLAGGGRHVIQTAGLTYAQYARSGFFQLIAVAVITLGGLIGLRALADFGDPKARRRVVALSEITVALTLVIVFVAVRRINLYEQVFGYTMLRLYVKFFSLWIGAVFVGVGMAMAGVAADRAWLPPGSACLGLLLLLGLNVVNPEAVVVRHNAALARELHRFDPVYVAGLSADAVPTLIAELPGLGADARAAVVARLCPPPADHRTGWPSYNLSRDRARSALAHLCAQPAGAPPSAQAVEGGAEPAARIGSTRWP